LGNFSFFEIIMAVIVTKLIPKVKAVIFFFMLLLVIFNPIITLLILQSILLYDSPLFQ
jgi:hypothetical protein